MAFCSMCGTQVLAKTSFCGSCGASTVGGMISATTSVANNTAKATTNSLDKKFHITLICAASIAVFLLCTTFNFGLIGVATGASWGFSVRLFMNHKKNNFRGTSQLDWFLIVICTTSAFILMVQQVYHIQGLLLVFVAVRALVMYFQMNSNNNV